jgi:thiol-disulfide isomerase/thioredoxin
VGLVLGVALVISLVPTSSNPPLPSPPKSTLASFIQWGVSVSDSTLESVGLPSVATPLSSLKGAPLLTDGGKPAVVYVGAEFCPYCAMQRWALIVALSRFGTFSNLGQAISSSSDDVFPDLQSWSFYKSTYSSPYITFDSAEVTSSTPTGTGYYEPLESMTPVEVAPFHAYDKLGGWPFVDVGNHDVYNGPGADAAVLQGLTLDQIGSDLSDPTIPVAQAVDGVANYLTAAICAVAPNSKAAICSAPFIAQAQARMASSPFNPNAS